MSRGVGHVFISYKREEAGVARKLQQALEHDGFETWWDEDIQMGQQWAQAIDDAVNNAGAIVVLWSSRSVGSKWVTHEASAAMTRGVYAPARIELVEIPTPYDRIQAKDLLSWDGDTSRPGYQSLVGRLDSLLPRPVPMPIAVARWSRTNPGTVGLMAVLAAAFAVLADIRSQASAAEAQRLAEVVFREPCAEQVAPRTGSAAVRLHGAGGALRGACLNGAKLIRGDLGGASFESGSLREADLTAATLTSAVLSDANLFRATLERASLYGTDLRNANLQRANLREADLRWVNLRGADLRDASLEDTRLYRADLRGARLEGTSFVRADLESADLRDSSPERAKFSSARLVGANLRRADMNGTWFDDADMREADLRGARLVNARLQRGVLSRAKLDGAQLDGSNLTEAVLHEATLEGADLRDTDLSGADLTKADLGGANLDGANLTRARRHPNDRVLRGWVAVRCGEELCLARVPEDVPSKTSELGPPRELP